MRIDRMLEERRPVFSFEFFPPRTDAAQATLDETLAVLKHQEPDYVSVTYGAGGATRDRTVEVSALTRDAGFETMTHLSCVGEPTARVIEILEEIKGLGIENILALRGDPPRGQVEWEPHPEGLEWSIDLIRLIAEEFPDFCIGAACFPEVHPEAPNLEHDLRYAREKVDAGASFLITQLFFDNRMYFEFVEEARAAGIAVPIIPGIMPIADLKQIKMITGLCGATIPEGLGRELERLADDPAGVAELGTVHAALQCSDLLAGGAPGIHFYTLNRSPATRAILAALRAERPWKRAAVPC